MSNEQAWKDEKNEIHVKEHNMSHLPRHLGCNFTCIDFLRPPLGKPLYLEDQKQMKNHIIVGLCIGRG